MIDVRKLDPEGGLVIVPVPGFVLKTKHNESAKLFFNICSSEFIEPAAELRVPLSIGVLTTSVDRKNNPCQVVDIVVNTGTLQTALDDPSFKLTLIDLFIAAVSAKFSFKNIQFVSCPALTYKGDTVLEQRIKVKRDTWIEETTQTAVLPEFTLACELADGRIVDGMDLYDSPPDDIDVLTLKVPGTYDQVQVSNERVEVSNEENSAFNVWFPVAMNVQRCEAQFANNLLEVRIHAL